jgi:hypothetical protein
MFCADLTLSKLRNFHDKTIKKTKARVLNSFFRNVGATSKC